jgi:hypothetical protein
MANRILEDSWNTGSSIFEDEQEIIRGSSAGSCRYSFFFGKCAICREIDQDLSKLTPRFG